jgi:capsular polysaccharide biosynthesis protein
VSTSEEQWQAEQGIDLRALLATLSARRWWIVGCVLVAAVACTTTAFVMTPVYRASVVLTSASTERNDANNALNSALGSLGSLASLAGLSVGGNDAATEESLAVLQSRQFTESFIDQKNLMPELFARQWDAKDGTWMVSAWRPQPTPARAFKYFDRHVRSVSRDKKTGLVTLQIEWRDRNESAQWANELVQRLNAEMRRRAIGKVDASLGYLQKELISTPEVGMREAIYRLIEGQIKQRMLADVTEEYAFRVVDRAMPSDADDPVRPKKPLLLIGGPFFGLVIGIALVMLIGVPRPRPIGDAT